MAFNKAYFVFPKSKVKRLEILLFWKTCSLYIIFLLLLFFANTKSHGSVEAPRVNKLLFEEIINEGNFTSVLNSLPEYLKAGSEFDENAVGKHFEDLQKESHVSEVPAWAYGTWRSDTQVQDFARVYGKGIISEKVELPVQIYDTIGDIITNEKKIYSIVSPGTVNKISRSNELNEYQISLFEKRKVGFGYFTCLDKSIRVQVEAESKKIIKSYIVESQKLYRPIAGKQSLYTEAWLKSFDEEGQPFIFSHSSSTKDLIERHKLVDLNEMQLGTASSQ